MNDIYIYIYLYQGIQGTERNFFLLNFSQTKLESTLCLLRYGQAFDFYVQRLSTDLHNPNNTLIQFSKSVSKFCRKIDEICSSPTTRKVFQTKDY